MDTTKIKILLERHIERINKKILKIEQLETKLSTLRVVYFISSIFILYALSLFAGNTMVGFVLVASILGFFYLIHHHNAVEESLKSFKFLKEIKEDHLARIDLNWERIEYNAVEVNEKNHPFAFDLDVLGKHSLFHLLDTSIYSASSFLLIQWLLSKSPNKKTILHRQQQVKELIPLTIFRDKLRVIGLKTKLKKTLTTWSVDDVLYWLRLPKKKNFKFTLSILSILSLLNISFFIFLMIGIINALPLTISLVSYLLIYKFNDQKVKGLFDAAFQIEQILDQFKSVLIYVEKYKAQSGSEVEQLLLNFQNQEVRPSIYIRKAQKMMGRASMQANKLWQSVVNAIVPWDLYYAMRMEDLKLELEPKLSVWLETFYEIEALNSLANFAMLHPKYVFPILDEQAEKEFNSVDLGHPLIPETQRVCNNFGIVKEENLLLITGSNMAGKSTFLRTVGINLILSYAGAPVCAGSLTTKLYRVFTSINVTDSLEDGYSHFYAEVKRLRYLLDELIEENKFPLFFFVDEIYKGTNNRERYIGSAAFLKSVAKENGIGLVSSHDLELADLDNEIHQLRNLHFVESIKDNKMHFEYTLNEGPCPSTNAVQIMKLEGLPT